MHLILGDVTERRSPTLCDSHYSKKITFHLCNCLLSMFAIFVVLLYSLLFANIMSLFLCISGQHLALYFMVTCLVHRHITMNLIQ